MKDKGHIFYQSIFCSKKINAEHQLKIVKKKSIYRGHVYFLSPTMLYFFLCSDYRFRHLYRIPLHHFNMNCRTRVFMKNPLVFHSSKGSICYNCIPIRSPRPAHVLSNSPIAPSLFWQRSALPSSAAHDEEGPINMMERHGRP